MLCVSKMVHHWTLNIRRSISTFERSVVGSVIRNFIHCLNKPKKMLILTVTLICHRIQMSFSPLWIKKESTITSNGKALDSNWIGHHFYCLEWTTYKALLLAIQQDEIFYFQKWKHSTHMHNDPLFFELNEMHETMLVLIVVSMCLYKAVSVQAKTSQKNNGFLIFSSLLVSTKHFSPVGKQRMNNCLPKMLNLWYIIAG